MPWTNHEQRTVGELPHISGKACRERRDAEGKPVYIHDCRQHDAPPEGWGARAPHPTRPGWVRYFIWLSLFVAPLFCFWALPALCK